MDNTKDGRAVDLLQREYARWRDKDEADSDAGARNPAAMGAMGAVANVLAELVVPRQPPGMPRPSGMVKPAIVHSWGRGWCGLVRVRLLVGGDGDEKTFWHLFLPFNFSVGVTLPSRVVDGFAILRGRTA